MVLGLLDVATSPFCLLAGAGAGAGAATESLHAGQTEPRRPPFGILMPAGHVTNTLLWPTPQPHALLLAFKPVSLVLCTHAVQPLSPASS